MVEKCEIFDRIGGRMFIFGGMAENRNLSRIPSVHILSIDRLLRVVCVCVCVSLEILVLFLQCSMAAEHKNESGAANHFEPIEDIKKQHAEVH
jgi:hypothetical protein